jgi:Tfp pilus assembly protein PilO
MLTNRTSRWSLACALLCAALLVASWFFLVSPRRAEAADVRSKAVASDSQAVELQSQIAQLKAEFADLPKRKAELKAIKVQLPPELDIPDFMRSLQKFAGQTGVSLDSLAPGTPAILSSSAAAATGSAASATAPAGSVVSVPLTISVHGEYFEASLFLKNLQTKLNRSYLITGLAAVPAPDEVVPTTAAPLPTPTATSTATSAPVPTAVATVAPVETDTLDRVSMTVTGSLFVLMDGTSSLEAVNRAARAAANGTAAPTAAVPTTAPSAGAGTGS